MHNEVQKPTKRSRAGGSKVKTGCVTCRIRRIKCDEGKPACFKCTDTGRKCDGYTKQSGVVQQVDGLGFQHSNQVNLSPERCLLGLKGTKNELRSFDFFRGRTAPLLSGYFDSGFWNGLLLQASHSDPTIRHAMMAVSSVHEQFETAASLETDMRTCQLAGLNIRFALQQYNAAITSLNSRLTERNLSLETLLMACLLFICLEFLRGEKGTAISHLHSGARILCSFRGPALSPGLSTLTYDRHSIEAFFVPIFARLNIVSAFFECPAPDLFPKLQSTPSGETPPVPASFSSLNEARICLTDLANLVVDFDVAAEHYRQIALEDVRVVSRQLETESKLHQWSSAFAEFLKVSLADMSSADMRGTTLLQIQHKGILLLLLSALTGSLPLTEIYNADFETIISLSEFMIQDPPSKGKYYPRFSQSSRFSFEMGIIPSLYLTATRCHSPSIRQKALDILSAYPCREGLWDSAQARSAAEKVTALRVDGVRYTWKDLGQFFELAFKPTQPP